ncbi:MAG: BON domain-containing protein [Vicinamibacterales bacterium]
MTRTTRLLGAAALVVACAACSDRDQDRAATEAREAGREAREAGRDAAASAREAGQAVAEAGREAASAAGAAIETMDVKTALMRDSRVDAGDIDVDTNHETRIVVLKGSVPTATQKTLAEDIARAQATGYRVDNQLTVRG